MSVLKQTLYSLKEKGNTLISKTLPPNKVAKSLESKKAFEPVK